MAEVFLIPKDLSAVNVDCARTLFGLFRIKGNLVANLEFIERDINDRRGVEEDILLLTFRGDETESLFSDETFDNTLHSDRVTRNKVQGALKNSLFDPSV